MKRWIIAAALMATTVAGTSVSATAGASTDELQVVRLECAVRAADAEAAAGRPLSVVRAACPAGGCRAALATRRPRLGHSA